MAVRIQFRRGTAAEWASADPTLAAGELGYEVDTAKFKLGDGSTAWDSLEYAGVNQQDIEDAVANVIDFAPDDLDTLVELAAAINNDPDFFNNISNSIAEAESNAYAYANVVGNAVTVSSSSYTDNAIANLIGSAPGTLDTLNELANALGDDPNFATTVSNSLANRVQFIVDTTANLDNSNPTLGAQVFGITSDTRRIKVGDGVVDWANLSYVGENFVHFHNAETSVHGISNTMNLVYQVDLTQSINAHNDGTQNVHGIANTANLAVASDLDDLSNTLSSTIANTYAPIISPSFTGEVVLPSTTAIGDVLGIEIGYLDGVTSGIQSQIDDKLSISDASNTYALNENTILTGNVTLPTTTEIGNVISTEIEHLQGVTSGIQAQIDDRLETSVAATTYAPIANASFTGDVTLPSTTTIGDVGSTEIQTLDGVDTSQSIQAQIDNKADLNGPTFTGTVALPTTTSIGDVSSAEIEHLNGVTSGIQTQLDGKLGSGLASSTYAPLANATLTGTVSLPATTSIGDISATELGYVDGVTSGIQSQLDNKAPLESPTFTGTVSGVTSSMVGLGSVDNTSDADKAVSTATQNALDLKLDLAGGTMTGKITLDGDPTQALHAVTKQYVDSVEAGLITRPSVRAATTANLSGTYANGTAGVGATLNLGQLATLDIDGITSWSLLDGILVKDQTSKLENGRYVVEQIGNDVDTDWILRRCSLCDTADEIPGSYIFVLDGTTNEQTGWVQHVADPATFTVGTDDIDVYQFAGAGSVTAGTNIEVSGTQVSVVAEPTFANVVTVSAGVKFADNTIQTSAGVPSLTEFTEKTASYTLDTLDHQDNVVEMNSGSALTFTIPDNATLAWPVGASMDIFQMGAGQVTIANAAGVTLNFTPGNKLRTQFSSCTIMKRGTDSWVLYGDLTA